MSYKTFSSVIQSGVGWLGDIPPHWTVLPAKALFSLRTEKALPDDVHLTPSQRFGVLPQAEYIEITGSRVVLNLTDSGQMKHVEPNDFVSHLRSFQGGLELSRIRGKVSGAYTVLKPRSDQNPEFWRYALKSDTYIQALQTTTDQLRDGQSIRLKEFAQIPLPLVPRIEQDAIVNYLDRELGQIDELIDKQNELSVLLQERRKKLITDTLILGLDSSASMTESKYEWLPKYPNHWSLSKIANLHKFKTGGTPASGNESFYGGEHLWATIGDLEGKEVLSTKQTLTSDGVASASMSMVPKGSLLFSFKLSVGQVAIAGADMYTNEAIAAFEPNPNVDLAWAYYAYAEFIPHFTSWNIYGARLMNQDLIRSARVPLPPLKEQKSIADFLDTEVAKIDIFITKAMQLKEALLQRRISLISAAVTGKLKLQGAN